MFWSRKKQTEHSIRDSTGTRTHTDTNFVLQTFKRPSNVSGHSTIALSQSEDSAIIKWAPAAKSAPADLILIMPWIICASSLSIWMLDEIGEAHKGRATLAVGQLVFWAQSTTRDYIRADAWASQQYGRQRMALTCGSDSICISLWWRRKSASYNAPVCHTTTGNGTFRGTECI